MSPPVFKIVSARELMWTTASQKMAERKGGGKAGEGGLKGEKGMSIVGMFFGSISCSSSEMEKTEVVRS